MKDLTGSQSKVSQHFLGVAVTITSGFWNSDKEYKRLFPQFLPHVAYDYRARVGTPVYACFDGKIVKTVDKLGSSYGRQIFLSNGRFTAHYAHLSSISVHKIDYKKGELLGFTGASGAEENTYSPHLHFGIAKGEITNASYKGRKAGDVWLDVEAFDFEQKKTNQEIVDEIFLGLWGDNPDRKEKLIASGYNQKVIQDMVNSQEQQKEQVSSDIGKKGKLASGTKTLFMDAELKQAYSKRANSTPNIEVLDETDISYFVKVDSVYFNPKEVWIAKENVVL